MVGRKRGDQSRGAHIRKSTFGTSNEISFSVLDAASSRKKQSDKKKGKSAWQSYDSGAPASSPLTPPPGEISLFTLGNDNRPPSTPRREQGITLSTGEFISTDPGRSSAAMPLSEVAIRKKSRRRARLVGVMASLILVLALIGGFTSLVASLVNAQNLQQDQLMEIVEQLEQTDAVLLALDEGVLAVTGQKDIDEGAYEALNQLLDQGNSEVLAQLDAVSQEAQNLEGRLMAGTDREVANNLIASAQARAGMIETGYAILQEALPLRKAQEDAHQGWQALGQAENLSRQAAQALSPLNEETVQASRDFSEQALAQLQQAKELFASAEESTELVDITSYKEYLQLKINASSAAIEADDAYIARNKERMDERNDAANQYEADAAGCLNLAQANPDSLYEKAFSTSTASLLQSYQAERDNVSVADERLREFLG